MITPEGFDDFVVTRSPRLLRTAFLLTRDWALAEDLLQTALVEPWEKLSVDGRRAGDRRRLAPRSSVSALRRPPVL